MIHSSDTIADKKKVVIWLTYMLIALKKIRGLRCSGVKWIFSALIIFLLFGIHVPYAAAGEVQQRNYFKLWNGNIPSIDPSGISYHWPSGHLFISDAEIDEVPLWNGVNIFETSLSGEVLHNSYDARQRGTGNGYREPSGITYSVYDGYFYIVNDNRQDIYRYAIPFGDYIDYVHINDDVPEANDAEGITSDPVTGDLYVLESVGGVRQVIVYNAELQFLYRFYIDASVEDPNGIAFDPVSRHLFISSVQTGPEMIFEYDTDGTYIDDYSLQGLSPAASKPYGGVFAPPSDPSINPDDLSLYIVDRRSLRKPDGDAYELKLCSPSCDCSPTGHQDDNCDGIDDDCDGMPDDEYDPLPTTCGVGECSGNTGQWACQGGSEVNTCDPFAGAVPEVCDGSLDEDCDGTVDEGCDCNDGDTRSCGSDTGECVAGTESCIGGMWNGICTGEVGPTAELCDGLDNDCDNDVDEDFVNLGNNCTAGTGVCETTGTYICKADQSAEECDAIPGVPTEVPEATCNDDLDNDCDGFLDSADADCSGGATTISVQITTSSDDAEELVTGRMSLGSSDLEMTYDKKGNQKIGLRFNSVNIPPDADITHAYIQFTVDETSSGTANLTIYGESSSDAATFTSIDKNISDRPLTVASAGWTPGPWLTVGAAGAAQQTPNIASIIEEIVSDGSGWAGGNSLVIIITGTGERVAESYNGTPESAPVLHIEYSAGLPVLTNIVVMPEQSRLSVGDVQKFTATGYDQYGNVTGINPEWSTSGGGTIDSDGLYTATTVGGPFTVTAADGSISGSASVDVADTINILEVQILTGTDDAEERADGSMSLSSSDLELAYDKNGNQKVGMRFSNVNIPAGADITYAYIQFTVDEISSGAANLTIYGEASPDASTFTAIQGDISERTLTIDSEGWTPDPWLTVGEAGTAQQTPNIASIIEEIVSNGSGWTSGNSLVIIITGTGERVAESYNGSPPRAPVLHIEFDVN
ncbi:MAG: hypothetical protein JSW20_06795 [Nitrospiraceae bacterium]|nr:MAG: hypothetical protein JSW20_06795 [Nitrospiraceae bacterium]